jgi:hypothetical protein
MKYIYALGEEATCQTEARGKTLSRTEGVRLTDKLCKNVTSQGTKKFCVYDKNKNNIFIIILDEFKFEKPLYFDFF